MMQSFFQEVQVHVQGCRARLPATSNHWIVLGCQLSALPSIQFAPNHLRLVEHHTTSTKKSFSSTSMGLVPTAPNRFELFSHASETWTSGHTFSPEVISSAQRLEPRTPHSAEPPSPGTWTSRSGRRLCLFSHALGPRTSGFLEILTKLSLPKPSCILPFIASAGQVVVWTCFELFPPEPMRFIFCRKERLQRFATSISTWCSFSMLSPSLPPPIATTAITSSDMQSLLHLSICCVVASLPRCRALLPCGAQPVLFSTHLSHCCRWWHTHCFTDKNRYYTRYYTSARGSAKSSQIHSSTWSTICITYLRPVRRAFERLFVPTSAGFSSAGMAVMLSFFSLTFCCNHTRLAAMWRVLPMPRRLARARAAEESNLQICCVHHHKKLPAVLQKQTQSNALLAAHIGFNEISIQINLGGWNQSFCSHDFQRSLHRKSFPWDDGHQRHLHV